MKRIRQILAPATAAAVVLTTHVAMGHFLWLVPHDEADSGPQLRVHFSEAAEPTGAGLLEHVSGVKVRCIDAAGETHEVPLQRSETALTGEMVEGGAVYLLDYDYGLARHGGASFRLHYYAKLADTSAGGDRDSASCGRHLPLDVQPTISGDRAQLTVQWQGEAVPEVQVVVVGPGAERTEATTDDRGRVEFPLGRTGTYAVRARYIEDKTGTVDGKAYDEIRHYSTVALNVRSDAGEDDVSESVAYPDLPQPVTSLGAAIVGDRLYVYGGHIGKAHSYSTSEQAGTLWRLDLQGSEGWTELGTGPRMQGLAMVAHGGKLYRLGGFTARNAEGEAHDLWSRAEMTCFDPATGEWREMPPMPEPRSSFDAVVLDDTVYVAGGWKLQGTDNDAVWHDKACAMDLSASSPRWEELPTQPFRRRALSLAAHEGKVYVVGGMRHDNEPVTRVDIYDPASRQWSQAPTFEGEPMEGFGSSSASIGGRLYVSTIRGRLLRLAADGSDWEVVRQLPTARFFHRMLPLGDEHLLFVGGANMSIGKFPQIDVLHVE